MARWFQARDAASRVLVLPSQTPGILDRVGLTREQVERDAWAIEPSGRAFAGAAAINRSLQELGPIGAAVAAAYGFPPLRWLEDRVYRWVAAHRGRLGILAVTPECDRPDVPCS